MTTSHIKNTTLKQVGKKKKTLRFTVNYDSPENRNIGYHFLIDEDNSKEQHLVDVLQHLAIGCSEKNASRLFIKFKDNQADLVLFTPGRTNERFEAILNFLEETLFITPAKHQENFKLICEHFKNRVNEELRTILRQSRHQDNNAEGSEPRLTVEFLNDLLNDIMPKNKISRYSESAGQTYFSVPTVVRKKETELKKDTSHENPTIRKKYRGSKGYSSEEENLPEKQTFNRI